MPGVATFVNNTVAVIVDAIALLGVEAIRDPVAVGIESFVDLPVAVIVNIVANLVGAWIYGGVGIITVTPLGRVAGRHIAAVDFRQFIIAVAIAIGVWVDGNSVLWVLIDLAIAIVVLAVAQLGSPGVDRLVAVVAVALVYGEPVSIFIDNDHISVSVVFSLGAGCTR